MTEAFQESEEQSLYFLLASRSRTDSQQPGAWILIPIAGYTLWALIAVILASYSTVDLANLTAPLSVLVMAGYLVSAATAYLVYVLVNRRNTHMAREQALVEHAMYSARSRTTPANLKALLPLDSAERNFAELSQISGERSAVLWALLTFIPYLGWLALIYVLSFLTHDLRKHEVNEDIVLQDLERALQNLGDAGLPSRQKRSPYRNLFPYAAVSLIFLSIALPGLLRAVEALTVAATATSSLLGTTNPVFIVSPANLPLLAVGLFGLGVTLNLWLYQALQDPRSHFDYHQKLESSLFSDECSKTTEIGGA